MIDIKFQIIREVPTPRKAYPMDAGIDFYIPKDLGWDYKTISPQKGLLIPSGVRMECPEGYSLVAFERSSISVKKKFIIGARVVDSGYRGELHIHIINVGDIPRTVMAGEKIAQFLVIPVPEIRLNIVDSINEETERGTKGFGSSDGNNY